jgi:transcriptional regulator with XRE-family HTH domain
LSPARPGAREELGERLHQYRDVAGLSGHALGAELGCNQSRISRIEAGKTRISPEQVRQWLDVTGAPADAYDDLFELAERAEVEVVSWKAAHAGGWAAHQNDYAAIEREASRILIWQSAVIPGLMQSGAYVRHFLAKVRRLPERQVAEGVAARLDRQDVLHQPGTHLEVVIAEHILRQRFGGWKVMVEQLHRVASLAQLPSVDLAVLPSDIDMDETYQPSAVIYLAPNEATDDLAVVELATSVVRERKPENVQRYVDLFRTYQAHSLRGPDAIEHVERIANQMDASSSSQVPLSHSHDPSN